MLSRGHSFRTRYKTDLIKTSCDFLSLGARLSDVSHHKTIAVRKSVSGVAEVSLDNEPLANMAGVARILPVRSFHPESHNLIHGGGSGRRRYLDWGVFHMKQGFLELWRGYQKGLSNRNVLLKTSPRAPDMTHWMEQMAVLGQRIDESRREYFLSLNPYIQELLASVKPAGEVGIRYFRGWDEERELSEVLKHVWEEDCRRGATRFGPHRADIAIAWDGNPAKRVISRGQQKTLALVLILAQIKHFTQTFSRDCAILVDDLISELDSEHLEWAVAELKKLGQQVIMTGITPDISHDGWPSYKLFHVKHSEVVEAS